jgi:hypothetical protein
MAVAKAQAQALSVLARAPVGDQMASVFHELLNPGAHSAGAQEMLAKGEMHMHQANAMSKAFRTNPGFYQRTGPDGRQWNHEDMVKSGAIAKSVLDVGGMTNLTTVTGGQSLGYVSLDTQLARATVRPNSFTLYQALNKSRANQITDYWAYIDNLGAGLPGTAFQGFGNVQSGTLSTTTGDYMLKEVNLALMVNGRAMTTALAAQNSFVDIAVQESTNSALSILSTVDWAMYWGNQALYPMQFAGLASMIPTQNVFNYQEWYTSYGATQGWSAAQGLFNLIYEAAAQITSYGNFGRITHAFMTPDANASLQSLVTTNLNNIVSIDIGRGSADRRGITVNGDLQGMQTRFGLIQFVLDLFISARDMPAQAILNGNGTNNATMTDPTPPYTVTAAVLAGASGSAWTTAYTTTPSYVYAVASCDEYMNESVLSYTAPVTTIAVDGAVQLTITPPTDNTAYAYRVYRSGNGYAKTGAANTPYSFRYIGTVLANGSYAVTFTDFNTYIPGSENIFLLDLSDEDNALDFRYLLPLTKIELFAQNLYMPWAVAMIGAPRVRIPRFHAMIQGYVADNPSFNPLSANN